MIKLHFKFMLTSKTRLIMWILVVITSVILIIQSNIMNGVLDYSYNGELYIETFLNDGFNIIKIVTILFLMLLVIYTFQLHKYDTYLLIHKSRFKVITTKILVVWLIGLLFLIFNLLVFLIIWGLIDTTLSFSTILHYLLFTIIFFSYYLALFVVLIQLYKTIFIGVVPFIGFLIGSLSIDYGSDVENLSVFSKSIQFIFPDLIILDKEIYFVYSYLYIITLTLLFLIVIIRHYKEEDIES